MAVCHHRIKLDVVVDVCVVDDGEGIYTEEVVGSSHNKESFEERRRT